MLKSTEARIVLGVPLGIVAGLILPFVGAAIGSALSSTLRFGGRNRERYVFALATSVLTFAAVPLLWRRGLRGVPIGLAVGAALPTLVLAACAIDDWNR